MDRYSETLLDHYAHPRRAGAMPDATGTGMARYPTCGDVTRIFVRVEGGILADARFQASGCGPGIACASVLLGMAVGQPVEFAASLSVRAVADAVELPDPKMHCAELSVAALRQALDEAEKLRAGLPPAADGEE